jgi:hypothetical protein
MLQLCVPLGFCTILQEWMLESLLQGSFGGPLMGIGRFRNVINQLLQRMRVLARETALDRLISRRSSMDRL